ncbi:MAG TPA: GNAT family N-acetyltransferase [Thermoanaerobaculia bacterium]|nr:GNAT family N-acetyltransferase [Thermoanaerobaculia bacterium]
MDILKTGKRVYLRGPLMTDATEFLSMAQASRRLHRPWVYPPKDRKAFYSYVHWARSGRMVGTLICLRETDEIVGVANLSELVRGVFLSAYLGFYGSIHHAGEGLVGEGVQLLIRHAFGQLKLHRVEANVQPANKKSLALVRRLGFRKEGFSPRYLKVGGRWRDHERWTLLAEGRRRG